jgi:hypothetical protein
LAGAANNLMEPIPYSRGSSWCKADCLSRARIMMIDKGMIKTMKEPTGAPPHSRYLASRLRSLIRSVPRPHNVELSYAQSVCCPFGHSEPLPAVRLTNHWNIVTPPAPTPSMCRRVVPPLSSTLWQDNGKNHES